MSSNNNNNTAAGTTNSASSRISEFFTSTPLYTTILLVLNVSIHIIVFLTSYPTYDFTFVPQRIYENAEYYRIFTSAFLHGGIMHIAMNMMSLMALGNILETNYGTLKFFYLTWLMIIVAGIFDVMLAL